MKKVAVSQRVDIWADRDERRDALDQRLCLWLIEAGYLPVPVPNGLALQATESDIVGGMDLEDWLLAVQPDAILLSGGNDVGAVAERDHTERCLLAYAQTRVLPLLGVCRGMQMMAVWAGCALKPVQQHVRTRHRLRGKLTGEVNSYHNYALADCPADFDVWACAEDGEIEAIRHHTLPWEGWMWHPERENPFQHQDRQRLRALFT